MATPTHAFFDSFFIAVILVAAALTFVDWLIGPSGRDKMRRLAGDWWVFVEQTSFGQQISTEANRFLDLYERKFERETWGDPLDRFVYWSRRIMFVLMPAFTALLATSSLWFLKYGLGSRLQPGQVGASTQVLILPMILSTALGVLGLWLLKRTLMIAARRDRSVSVLISLSAVVFYAICVAAIAVFSVVTANLYEFNIRPLYQSNIVHSGWTSRITVNLLGGLTFLQDPFVSLMAFVFSTTATGIVLLIFIAINFVFVFSKVFRFALKPVCSLLLQRFYDSDKGVLTVIGIGGGALAKLIQVVLKVGAP